MTQLLRSTNFTKSYTFDIDFYEKIFFASFLEIDFIEIFLHLNRLHLKLNNAMGLYFWQVKYSHQ